MKMRKVLALLLTLMFVFAVAAFAQESGNAADPANPAAGQTAATTGAATEAAATQAFSRSLDVYGVYTWRYEYNGYDVDKSAIDTVQSTIRHMVEANFSYKISPVLSFNFSLAWGDYYGRGRSRGFYSTFQDSYLDDLSNLGTSEFTGISATNQGTLVVKRAVMYWKTGFLNSELRLGRQDTTWGYHSVFYGSYSGADRILWIGDMKLFGMRFMPLAYFEVRNDKSNKRGDEQLLMSIAFIAIAPGKLLEQLWLSLGYYMPTKNTNLYDRAPVANSYNYVHSWQFFTVDAYAKLRIGNMILINLEIMYNKGRVGKIYAHDGTNSLSATDIPYDVFAALLNAEVKLGILKLTPEVVFITAPKTSGSGTLNTNGMAAGWMPRYIDYQVGGRLISNITSNLLGMYEGLLSFSLKLEASLGKITPWLKVSYMMSMTDDKVGTFAPSAALAGFYTGGFIGTGGSFVVNSLTPGGRKGMGFEIDLGADIQLAEGFTMGVEFGYLIAGKRLQEDVVGLYEVKIKSAIGAMIKFDLKF
jgi:hypothetical protein